MLEVDFSLFFTTTAINKETGKFCYVLIQDKKRVDDKKVSCFIDRGMYGNFDKIQDAVNAMDENVSRDIRRVYPNIREYEIFEKIKSGMYISQYINDDTDLCRIEVLERNGCRLSPLFHITKEELRLLENSKRAILDCTGYDENEMRVHYYVK